MKFRLFQGRHKIVKKSNSYNIWELAILEDGRAFFRKTSYDLNIFIKGAWKPCEYKIVKEYGNCKIKHNGLWLYENLGIVPNYRFPKISLHS